MVEDVAVKCISYGGTVVFGESASCQWESPSLQEGLHGDHAEIESAKGKAASTKQFNKAESTLSRWGGVGFHKVEPAAGGFGLDISGSF